MAVFCNAAPGCRSVWLRPRCERRLLAHACHGVVSGVGDGPHGQSRRRKSADPSQGGPPPPGMHVPVDRRLLPHVQWDARARCGFTRRVTQWGPCRWGVRTARAQRRGASWLFGMAAQGFQFLRPRRPWEPVALHLPHAPANHGLPHGPRLWDARAPRRAHLPCWRRRISATSSMLMPCRWKVNRWPRDRLLGCGSGWAARATVGSGDLARAAPASVRPHRQAGKGQQAHGAAGRCCCPGPLTQGQEERGQDQGDAGHGDGNAEELEAGEHDEPLGAEGNTVVRAGHSGLARAEQQPSADHAGG
jgi:hypothetical protein